MNALTPIAAMAAAVYGLRVGGLLLTGWTPPTALERALRFVPVATLTALVVAGVTARPGELSARLLAAGAAALIMWRFGRAWLCIAGGLAAYWLLRLA